MSGCGYAGKVMAEADNTNLQKYSRLVMLAGMASVTMAVVFVLLKLAVWLLSGSSSIFASLTDSMFDSLASCINLLALKYSLTPPDREHRYGHYKAQALASLAQAAFIGGSALLLIIHGAERFSNPQPLEQVPLALGVSVFGVVFTLVLVTFQGYVYKKTKSEAIGADRFHYLSDIMLNLGVIFALFLSWYGHLWADGLFAAIIGGLIMRGAWQIGLGAVNILLDRTLTPEENHQIVKAIISVAGVESLHDLKTRRAGPCCYIQAHLVINGRQPLYKAHIIADRAERNLLKLFPDADVVLHMEPDGPDTQKDVKFKEIPGLGARSSAAATAAPADGGDFGNEQEQRPDLGLPPQPQSGGSAVSRMRAGAADADGGA